MTEGRVTVGFLEAKKPFTSKWRCSARARMGDLKRVGGECVCINSGATASRVSKSQKFSKNLKKISYEPHRYLRADVCICGCH